MIETLSGVKQTIAYGPMASLESIKHLGTNGGGFLGANSSTPLKIRHTGLITLKL